jgi:hypothetical protein
VDDETITAAVTARPMRQPKAARPNTCAPSSKTKRLNRQLAGIMAHLEQNPNDQLSLARVATIKSLLAGS